MLPIEQRVRYYEPFFDKWYLNDPPEILGQGSSGTVFLVHSFDDMSAALKVISIPRDEDQYMQMLSRFGGNQNTLKAWIDQELYYAQSEIQIMNQLKREPHIVCFEDAMVVQRSDTYGYDIIIRMEQLVRLDMFMRVCNARYNFRRDEELALRIWMEVAQGLSFCERYGIVHFDVKPENIFYAEPSRNMFKLGDFGVSIRSDNGRMVGEGMIVGTRNYMAPEIANAYGGDIRSDMYSLGLVMYQIFNNDRLPFVQNPMASDAEYDQALTIRFSGAPLPPPKDISPDLWVKLRRCLAYDPNERYPTMQALIDDLDLSKRQIEKKKIFRHVLRPALFGVIAAVMIVLMIVVTRPSVPPTAAGPSYAVSDGARDPMAQADAGGRRLEGDMLPGQAGRMDMGVDPDAPDAPPQVVRTTPARPRVGPIAAILAVAAALATALGLMMRVLVNNARLEIGDDRKKDGSDAKKRMPMQQELRFALTAGIMLLTTGLGVAIYALIAAI